MMKNIFRISFIVILLIGMVGFLNDEVEASPMDIEFSIQLDDSYGVCVPEWELRITDISDPSNFAEFYPDPGTYKVVVTTIEYDWMIEGSEVTFNIDPDRSDLRAIEFDMPIHGTWDGLEMTKCTGSYVEDNYQIAEMDFYMQDEFGQANFVTHEPPSALYYGEDKDIRLDVQFGATIDSAECCSKSYWKYFRILFEAIVIKKPLESNETYDWGVLEISVPPDKTVVPDPWLYLTMSRGVNGAGSFRVDLEITVTDAFWGQSKDDCGYEIALIQKKFSGSVNFNMATPPLPDP